MKLYDHDARFTPSIDSRLGTFHFNAYLMEKAKDGMSRKLVLRRDRIEVGSSDGTIVPRKQTEMPEVPDRDEGEHS